MSNAQTQIIITFHENGDELHIGTEVLIPAGASPLLQLATETAVNCLLPLFETVQQAATGQLDPSAPRINPNN